MNKAQGSLEYLIIIAAVLVVSGVVAMLVTGSTISSKDSAVITSCQAAAKQCALLHKADSSLECDFCDEQCLNEIGEPVIPNAVDCCKLGNSDGIYEGSVEVCTYVPPEPPVCNNNFICDAGETVVNCPNDCLPPSCTPATFGNDCLMGSYDDECVDVSCPSGECVYDAAFFEGSKCNDRVGYIDECVSGVCVGTEITECNDIESDGYCPSGCDSIEGGVDSDIDCPTACGNGDLEFGEICEPSDFEETCVDVGFTHGTLGCSSLSCTWDVSGCGTVNPGACISMSRSWAKDSCFINLATITGNCSYCDLNPSWTGGWNEAVCLAAGGVESSNSSCCDKIPSTYDDRKDDCYSDIAIDIGDASLCSFMDRSWARDGCFVDAVSISGVCSDCNLNPSWTGGWYEADCLAAGAVTSCDYTCCDMIPSSYDNRKDNCYEDTAVCP